MVGESGCKRENNQGGVQLVFYIATDVAMLFQKFNKKFHIMQKERSSPISVRKNSRCKSDIRETWKLVRKVSCTKPRQRDNFPDFFCHQNCVCQDSKEIADNFNNFLQILVPIWHRRFPKVRGLFRIILAPKQTVIFDSLNHIKCVYTISYRK